MTQKAIIQLIIVLAVVSLLGMITGCRDSNNDNYENDKDDGDGNDDTSNDCCQECLEFANKDPSGYDISIKPCSAYGLSCDQRVGDCRNEDGY